MTPDGIPTARDVVQHLNRRFEELGLPYRLDHIAVLPYVSPMWLSNWDVPQLAEVPEREIVDREIHEARWLFPQVMEDFT